jgi:hypothetical protein
MKMLFCYVFAFSLLSGLASCSSNSKTSADSDTTPALSTKPAEQAPVSTATPEADTLSNRDSSKSQ